MKPGGNFTQPHYDPLTESTRFQVFVGWHLYDTKDSDAEATQALREAVSPRFERVEAFEKTRA